MNDYEFRDPSRFIFNDYINQTMMHPIAVVLLAFTVFAFLVGDRKYWFLLMGLVVCNLSAAQRVAVFEVDFNVLRLVGLLGFTTLLVRGEFRALKAAPLDKIIVAYLLLPAILAPLRGQSDAVMNHLGAFADGVMIYFIGRVALRDLKDVSSLAWALLIISAPIAIAMMIEKLTGRNFFSVLGGIPEITPVREGKLRAQGAFAHPIIAGCWFAASIPILISQWKGNVSPSSGKTIAIVGSSLALLGVFATASSTPIAGACVVVVALLIYPFRNSIKLVRPYVILLALVAHFASLNGIHHIIYTRFVFVAGSTGYHRYKLVDAAINQFSSWFLIGTNGTYSWGYGLDDVTHEFVMAAVAGGLWGLLLLVAILVISFKNAGSLMSSENPKVAFVGFFLATSLVVHFVAFLGVSYYAQIVLLYYFTVGGLQTLAMTLASKPRPSAMIARRPSQSDGRPARSL